MKTMLSSLIRLRFKALYGGMLRKKGTKKSGAGTKVLFVFLYVYLVVVFFGLFGSMFLLMADTYHEAGLDWLYFSMAGLMGFALSLIGSVFTTQDQLYSAKDNDLLLSMPIPSWMILLSRMISLYAMNIVFSSVVLLPAIAVYIFMVGMSVVGFLFTLVNFFLVPLLALAVACVLGLGLHKLIQRMNKSVVTLVYLAVFLVLYFFGMSKSNAILAAMVDNGAAISGAMRAWGWPMYAFGMAATGSAVHFLIFAAIVAAVFGVIYLFLSCTFLNATLAGGRASKRRKVDLGSIRSSSVTRSLIYKEWRRFFTSPTYLANMGMGVIMIAAMGVAGVIFRSAVRELLVMIPDFGPILLATALLATATMAPITAASISMEGKNLWILRAMPLDGWTILKAKLLFHVLMLVPVSCLAALVLSIVYGFGIADILLCTLLPALSCLFVGLAGLLANLKWPRFDWVSDAYPCKQAAPVMVTTLGGMGLIMVIVAVVVVMILTEVPVHGLAVLLGACALFAALDALLLRALRTWGVRQWENL